MKLENSVKEKLCRLSKVLDDLNYRYAVIGATAFLVQGVDLTRTTRDIDFSVLLDGEWGAFENLKGHFLKEGFRATRIPHRMKSDDGFIIDLLPVGDKLIKDESIYWPDGAVMNANGLREAIENAAPINIDDYIIPVAPLPVVVMMKLFAYGDQGDLKHIKDILHCFSAYERNRRFDLFAEEIEGLTYENAGAYLLGRDLLAVISKRHIELIDTILSESERRLFIDDEERELLMFFMKGMILQV